MTIIMGIDPGISGAVAFFMPRIPSRVSVYDTPVVAGEINAGELARLIRLHKPDVAIVEKVASMPGQGVRSVFTFGQSFGTALGVVAAACPPDELGNPGIRLYLVPPQRWKKHFGLSSDKEQCRLRAIRMFPAVAEHFKLKKHHGRAEAALMALYGAEVLLKVAA